jgi:hypothetical protein
MEVDVCTGPSQVAQVIFWFGLDSGLVGMTAGLIVPLFFSLLKEDIRTCPQLMPVTQKINN